MCPIADTDNELLVRARTRIGEVLRGKYRIDDVLGVGGMAAVYVVTHRNKKRFAVKVLHPELSLRADLRARFLREGYAANSVGHPGTVAVLDDDVADDGSAFLVMELLEGETLEQRWERSGRRLPIESVLSIGHQLLDVLSAAHARGIIHRDIKPANVFLVREGNLKVLDFGIARVRDAAQSHATQSGALMGTPAYMAPEQALGASDDVDARTDIWASGATLFALASGRTVHEAPALRGMIVMAATQHAPSLATVLPGAPATVVHAIDTALAFDREKRWPNADAMRDALNQASVKTFGRGLTPDGGRGPSGPETLASQPPADDRRPFATTAYAVAGPRPLTTAPVSSDPVPTVPGLRRGRRVLTIVAGGGGAAVLLSVALSLIVWTRHGRSPRVDTGAAGTTMGLSYEPAPPGIPPTTTAPTVVASDVAGAPASSSVRVPDGSTASVPAAVRSTVSHGPILPAPSSRRPDAAAAVVPPTTTPSSAPASTPPPTASTSCHMVLDHYDKNWQPIYRQVCN
jgi:serine/threonine-protein kinase